MNARFPGFPGHARLLTSLADAVARCDPRKRVAVLLIRVRHLSEIKSIHGYEAAEVIVGCTAERAHAVLRETDLIERIEDACFALVLPDLAAAGQAELAAAGLVRSCQQLLEVHGEKLTPKVTIGIAVYPDHAATPSELVRCADVAIGEALDSPDAYALYARRMEQARLPPHAYQLERALERALGGDELHVCFQPKISLRDGRLTGAEALLRWTREDGQAIGPDVFIPIAEQSNLIVPLTVWTLNTAMRACGELLDRDPGFSVAVNLSPTALSDPDIFPLIAQAVGIWCAERSQLVLEITETALFKDPTTAVRTLDELHGEGIRLSIDDFGTGYSSLAQLARLNLAELKIDRSFVSGVTHDPRSMQIVRSVIDLAHNFGMTVVAEGIEDADTLNCLAALGCDHGQGYFIARPMRRDDFLAWCDARQQASAPIPA